MTEPNMNVTRQHMQQLEFLVAQDIFINESGAYADVIPPAAAWAEKEGTFTNTGPSQAQRGVQGDALRGQARADWEIRMDLAQRIEQRLDGPTAPAGATRTPSRSIVRWRASPLRCLAALPMLVSSKLAAISRARRDAPRHAVSICRNIPLRPRRFFPLEYVPVAEEPDEEFPFVLTTGRLLEHWHGGTMTALQLDVLYPEAFVELHETMHYAVAWQRRCRARFSRRGSIAAARGRFQGHATPRFWF